MTSDCDARQEEHVLDGLGDIGVAQIQHRIVAVVPPKEDGPLLTCWIDSTSMNDILQFGMPKEDAGGRYRSSISLLLSSFVL